MSLNAKLWFRLNNKRTFIKILVTLISINSLFLILNTYSLFSVFSRATLNDAGIHTESLLKQRAESTSVILDWNFSYALQWSQNKTVFTYALLNEIEPYNNALFMMEINNMKMNNPFIESIYVINGYTKTVANTKNGVVDSDKFYDKDIFDIINQWNTPYTAQLIPRYMNTRFNDQPYRRHLFSVVYLYEKNVSSSAFVVNFDVDKIHSFLGGKRMLSGGGLFLLDQNNTILSSSDQGQFLKKFEMGSGITFGEKGYNYDKNSGMLYAFADISFSGNKGWRIVQVIPKEQVLTKLTSIRNTAYLFFSIIFILSVFTLWVVSKRIYSPLQKLVHDAKDSYKEKLHELEAPANNEISFLSSILKWHDNKERFNRMQSKQIFLKKLLLEKMTIPPEKIYENFKEYRVQISPSSLVTVIIRIDGFTQFVDKYNPTDQGLMRYAMCNIVEETLLLKVPVEVVDMGTDHIVAICEIQSSDLNQLEAPIRFAIEKISELLQFTVTGAVSSVGIDYIQLFDLYKLTLDLTNDRFIKGTGQLFFVENSDQKDFIEYGVIENTMKKMLSEFRLGHEEETSSIFVTFIDQIKTFNYSEVRLAATHLLLNFGKALNQMRWEHDQKSYRWKMPYIHQQLDQFETLNDLRIWMESIFQQYFKNIKEQRLSRNRQILLEIRVIIDQHLFDPNLSSKFISDRLGLTVDYVRNIFKLETNESLSEYITGLRIENAKKLLLKTDMSIEEIVNQSGFVALKSFYAIFKKAVGMTPAQYRRSGKKSE